MDDDLDDDYISTLIKQRVSEMSETEFDQLIAETRPPKLDLKQAAAEAVRAYRGHRT